MRQRKYWITGATLMFLLFTSVTSVFAADKTVTDTIDYRRTNWSEFLSIDKFDPALGTLTHIEITMSSGISGTTKFENVDSKAAIVNLNLSADIALQRPDSTQLLLASPLIQKTENVGAFDGSIDYGGTSGATLPNQKLDTVNSINLTSAADLALFSGAGQISLPTIATGTSSGSGPGNLRAIFNVDAKAMVTIKYTYTPLPSANIHLEKTVYASHDDGASCQGKNLWIGQKDDPITYCFEITNTGSTYLASITLTDPDLNIDLADMTLISGDDSLPLAPGDKLLYYYETTLQGNLINTATTVGNPADENSNDIPELSDVSDNDDAEVRISANGKITVCKYGMEQNPLAWIMRLQLDGTTVQNGKTDAQTGCITFTVDVTGTYTILENSITGWNLVDPAQGFYTQTVETNGEYGPFDFINEKVTIIRACKVDDRTGDPLRGWQLILNGAETQKRNTGSNGCVSFEVATAGNYTLTETLQDGWTQVFPGSPDYLVIENVVVGTDYGLDNEYTFRNTTQTGVTIVKKASPADGTNFSFSSSLTQTIFTLDDTLVDDGDGISNSIHFDNLVPGTYTVTELVPDGWTTTNITCSDDNSGAVDHLLTIALAAGEALTCTFDNLQPGRIEVQKQTTLPSSQAFDFSANSAELQSPLTFGLQNGGIYTIENVTPGSIYSITESLPAGWQILSASCDNEDSPTSISVAAGQTVRCTFINEAPSGSITIKKVSVPADGTDFAFASPLESTGFMLDDSAVDDSDNVSDTVVFGNLAPGSYTVEEMISTEWALIGVDCTDINSTANGTLLTIQLEASESLACTFINHKRGEIIVQKQTIAPSSQAFDFVASGGDLQSALSFSLQNGGRFTIVNALPGSAYVISETIPTNWQNESATCSNGHAPSQVTVTAGQVVTCTFVNAEIITTTEPASLGDFVWVDINKDGIQNDGTDSGVLGVTVKLFHGDGTFTGKTTTTDLSGKYVFTDLTPGSYFVEFTPPIGYKFTTPSQGSNNQTDSDANPTTGRTAPVTLNPGDNNLPLDAGVFAATKLVVTKRPSSESIAIGEVLTYTVNFSNTGALTATNVVLTETVPNFTTFLPERSSPGWSCVGGEIVAGTKCTFPVGKLTPNQAAPALLFVVQVNRLGNVPTDGIPIFNTISICDLSDLTTCGEFMLSKPQIPPPTPTNLEEDEEPQATKNQLFLPLVNR